MVFHIEHVIAKKHGGPSSLSNLALSCDHCNLHKGSDLTGIDPVTRKLTRLFNPRKDNWKTHFAIIWVPGAVSYAYRTCDHQSAEDEHPTAD